MRLSIERLRLKIMMHIYAARSADSSVIWNSDPGPATIPHIEIVNVFRRQKWGLVVFSDGSTRDRTGNVIEPIQQVNELAQWTNRGDLDLRD